MPASIRDSSPTRPASSSRRTSVLVVSSAERFSTVKWRSAEDTTSTDVRLLDDAGRVGELSRMLAGMEGSGLAQAHAEELLAAATAAKHQDGRVTSGPMATAARNGGELA